MAAVLTTGQNAMLQRVVQLEEKKNKRLKTVLQKEHVDLSGSDACSERCTSGFV